MTGNRALLTNFVEKFLGTVRFDNNDFAVIAGYGDVVIGSMTIKKVYYVEGLGHNLFSVGQFCDKGLEVAFRKSTCFVRNGDGVDLLTGDHSSNLYTIALNEVASNSSTCFLAKASSLQSWLWHQHKMSRDVLTVGSTMRIPLLYRGEYSQRVERFMNYLEEQKDGEEMINSIKNGDQPLPRVTQVSITGTSSNEQPPLKDKSMCNKTAKDLWDALARHMLGSEYGEQDRKAAILSVVIQKITQNQGDVNDAMRLKKKTVVVTSDPLALIAEKTKVNKSKEKVVVSDSEGSGAGDFSELKKITALLAKAFNQRKFYFKPTNNNLRTSSTSQSANKKQEFVKSDDKKVEKKDDEKKRDMSRVKCYNCKKKGHFAKDCKKAKVKDYNYYKTKMLLAKKDNDEQVLLAEDQAWMESNESSSSAEETIAEVAYYTSEFESESEFETSEYYDNSTNYGLFFNNDDDQEIFHDAVEFASENFFENHIDSQKDYDKSKVDHNDSKEKEHLIDELIRKFNHKIAKCQKRIKKANQQTKDLENQNKDLQDKYDVLINQVNTFEEQKNEFNEQIKVLNEKNADLLAQTKVLQDQLKVKHVVIDTHTECQAQYAKLEEERYEYMIIYSALCDNCKQHRKKIDEQDILFDNMSHQYNGRKGIGFENPRYFEKAKHLRPSLYNEKVISLGYTLMFLIHSDEALEIEKFQTSSLKPYVPTVILEKIIINLEDEVVSLLEKEKANLKTIKSLKSKGFESSENAIFKLENQSENDCHVVEKESQSGEFKNLDTFSSVRRPKQSSVIWKKKGLSNTSNVDLSFILQICLWILDSGCSKHMTGNRALLTNFVEKFLGTVRFGNNDFAMIAGYGDVVIGSMSIKKVYYVEVLGHNLFSVGKFCDRGLEVAFRKSTWFVRNEDGVDLLTGDRSSNLYTIALNEVASNSSTCLLAKASSS
nr:integrase, catalytic region, zinc finger, CCHC-type, peptidase aspartic, catalytic [Tanacetum cinerariifolium]